MHEPREEKRPARTPGVFRSQPLNPAGGRFHIPLESTPAGVDFQRNLTRASRGRQ